MSFLTPPSYKPELPKEQVEAKYKALRWQVFIGIFVGYAGYYLVRKNFTMAMPQLEEMGYEHAALGVAISANAIAYAFSKFLMGSVSDRSDARKFLPLGLLLSAGATMLMGTALGISSLAMMFVLQFCIGWFQGMGWPPYRQPPGRRTGQTGGEGPRFLSVQLFRQPGLDRRRR